MFINDNPQAVHQGPRSLKRNPKRLLSVRKRLLFLLLLLLFFLPAPGSGAYERKIDRIHPTIHPIKRSYRTEVRAYVYRTTMPERDHDFDSNNGSDNTDITRVHFEM